MIEVLPYLFTLIIIHACHHSAHGLSCQMNEMSTGIHKFYILRHGETDANSSGQIQGSSDFSRLTERGEHQARGVGLELPPDFDVSNIYVSPLTRARDTLVIVQETLLSKDFDSGRKSPGRLSHDAIVMNKLREIDFYEWEGLHKHECKDLNPESYLAWKMGDPVKLMVRDLRKDKATEKYPLLELWDRAADVWKEIFEFEKESVVNDESCEEKRNCGSSLIVCHGSLGQALLGSAFGKDAHSFRENEFPNCGMAEIEWNLNLFFDENDKKPEETASRWRWFHPEKSQWKE